MPYVVYTTNEGWEQVREVPKSASAHEYGMGVLVGPPDLHPLMEEGLEKSIVRQINNALVKEGLLTYREMKGNRETLLRILREYIKDEETVKRVRNRILSLYQQEYFPENFGGVLDG